MHNVIIDEIVNKSKKAFTISSITENNVKNKALLRARDLLLDNYQEILDANKIDLDLAEKDRKNAAYIDRLHLNKDRLSAAANALIEISKLPDPVGKIIHTEKRPNGLLVKRVTVPLGVITIIYESRPNVTIDAWGLCLKSGNTAILRPGSDSFNSALTIMKYLSQALNDSGLPADIIQILPDSERQLLRQLLLREEDIDVVIPRGGKDLIRMISSITNIPIFKHLDGNCHSYIHKDADLDKAINIIYNAKMRRTGICGATESVVIDRDILPQIIPMIADKFRNICEIRADEEARKYADNFLAANDQDFATEYLDAVFSIKTVANIDEAITHINRYSSAHTEAIITENEIAANEFLKKIDSAIVMLNSSTQFADGGELGLGAEIGISTGRMHARGPVGIEQLVTYKYQIIGTGQVRK
jgi:glutamate-5-semialdehyde dehydrogenase